MGTAGRCSHIPESILMLSACSFKGSWKALPRRFGWISALQPAVSCPCVDQHAAHISLSTWRCRQGRPLMRIVKVRKENVVVSKFQGELIRKDSAPSDVLAGSQVLNTGLETHCTVSLFYWRLDKLCIWVVPPPQAGCLDVGMWHLGMWFNGGLGSGWNQWFWRSFPP